MRKFISVVAVLAMLMSLAVPAFASEGSSVGYALPEAQGQPTDADGTPLEGVELVIDQSDATEEEIAAAEEAAKALDGVDDSAVVSDVFEIHLEDLDGAVVEPDGTVVVVLTGLGNDVVAIMYQAEDGSWDSAKFEKVGDGSYKIWFEHFCTVVVLSETAPAPTPAQPGDKDKTSDDVKSPQTGFDATVWVVATIGLLLCAGFCFVKAGKKASK